MKQVFLISFTVLLVFGYVLDAAAAPKPKQATHKSATAKPTHAGTKRISAARRQASASKQAMIRAGQTAKALQTQIVLARNGEQSLRRRHEGQNSSQARNAIRRATLERANLENRYIDAQQQLQTARSSFRQARAQLRTERRSQWQNLTGRTTQRPVQLKARKLTFAAQPLGPTGSGRTRSENTVKGVLKMNSSSSALQ